MPFSITFAYPIIRKKRKKPCYHQPQRCFSRDSTDSFFFLDESLQISFSSSFILSFSHSPSRNLIIPDNHNPHPFPLQTSSKEQMLSKNDFQLPNIIKTETKRKFSQSKIPTLINNSFICFPFSFYDSKHSCFLD